MKITVIHLIVEDGKPVEEWFICQQMLTSSVFFSPLLRVGCKGWSPLYIEIVPFLTWLYYHLSSTGAGGTVLPNNMQIFAIAEPCFYHTGNINRSL